MSNNHSALPRAMRGAMATLASPCSPRTCPRQAWAWHPPVILFAVALAAIAGRVPAAAPEAPAEPMVREILVPFEDLNVLLQGQTQRVLLSRAQYEELLKKAKKSPETKPPYGAVLLAADYRATLQPQRAQIAATLVIDVLADGLQAVPLDVGSVGLRSATLDGHPAPIGSRTGGERPMVFVQGRGRHELKLDLVAPVETTAARQTLHLRLPRTPSAHMELTVPGDVEIRSGADVIRRTVDVAARQTRFELVPPAGDACLVMSLNSHLQGQQRVVIARSVQVCQVTQAYERLLASVSLEILHRPVEQLRFVVPEGFEVTQVGSPLLARWAIVADGPRRVLEVRLRQATTDPVVLDVSAQRTPARLDAWTMPVLEPLDVAGQVALLGLAVEQRLRTESLAASGLVPVDTSLLERAVAQSAAGAEPGSPRLVDTAAYYAPQAKPRLTARFVRPPVKLSVTSSLLLTLDDGGCQLSGVMSLAADAENLFGFDLAAPADWQVLAVTSDDGRPLVYEHFAAPGKPPRIHVTLAQSTAAGEECRVRFRAARTPEGWLSDWTSQAVEFPKFDVLQAAESRSAIGVVAHDDITVRPDKLDQLTPLEETAKGPYGLAGVATNLAYRCESPAYRATLRAGRTRPRLTARTIAFVRVEPDALVSHYELLYQVADARVRHLSLLLPESTPTALEIRGLGGVRLKQFAPEPAVDGLRRWNVLLEEAQLGTIRLAVDFQQPLSTQEHKKLAAGRPESNEAASDLGTAVKDLALPIARADGVSYQSGLFAVEGSPELDVQVTASGARRVDVGELADAEYQPGRRLLGAFGFVADGTQVDAEVKISVARHPGYPLYAAIAQQAELRTLLAAEGLALTEATFRLHTKAVVLEARLPPRSQLWSVYRDGEPVLPQRDGESVLITLPAATGDALCGLRIVYETPIEPVAGGGPVELQAPTLLVRADRKTQPVAVPLADLVWHLELPTGYDVVRSQGSVVTEEIIMPTPAPIVVGGILYRLTGGLYENSLMLLPAISSAGAPSRTTANKSFAPVSGPVYPDGEYAKSYPRSEEESATPAAKPAAAASEYPVATQPMAGKPPAGELRLEAGGEKAAAGATGSAGGKAKRYGEPTGYGATSRAAREAVRNRHGGGRIVVQEEEESKERLGVDQAGESSIQNRLKMHDGRIEPSVSAKKTAWKWGALEAQRSPWIAVQQDAAVEGHVLNFHSLGDQPRLAVVLAERRETNALGWILAMATFLAGVALSRRPWAAKARFVLAVALLAMLVPWGFASVGVARVGNMVFYAASLLVVYYLLAALAGAVVRGLCAPCHATSGGGKAAAAAVVFAAALLSAATARAERPRFNPGESYIITPAAPLKPVHVPEDALLRPYDPQGPVETAPADRLLVPYAKYVELWNRAYPDKKLETPKPPTDYALAGGEYRATLEGDDYLRLQGQFQIDIFSDAYVEIPFALRGGVLARADLDGHPARLQTARLERLPLVESPAVQQQPVAQSAAEPPAANADAATLERSRASASGERMLMVLYASGKGTHRLELEVRLKLERHGGWRVAEGSLPAAAATRVVIVAPQPQTEIRLGQMPDRPSRETARAGESWETALGPAGAISIQWRPKLAEGQVDQTLETRSRSLLDVCEDGLRWNCAVELEFRHGQREAFRLDVPGAYLVEKVEGPNVRGWEARAGAERQSIEVALLKPAKDREEFTVRLARRGPVGRDELAEFDVPAISVDGAARHSGRVTIRRSPLLDVRVLSTRAVERVDLESAAAPAGSDDPFANAAASAVVDSMAALAGAALATPWKDPLGVRPFQSYAFAATPFAIRLSAAEIAPRTTAQVQSLLKISEYQRNLESCVILTVEGRPIYRVELFVPDDLEIRRLSAPGEYHWADTRADGRRLVSIYLTAGCQGALPIVLQGVLGSAGTIRQLALPRIEVRGAAHQQGDIAVQVDPAFDVEAAELFDCQPVLREQLYGWLNPEQREITRLALAYREPDYRGTLRLSARKAAVHCFTISNVRVTSRAVEETMLLEFSIEGAGIRELSFLLPESREEPRVQVPMLREKTIRRVKGPGSPWRVHLELQEERSGQLRVLVENDRVLTGQQNLAPIPTVETGRTDRQFVVLESSSRDEVVVEDAQGLDPLGRHQSAWQLLRGLLGEGITQAYLVAPGAEKPRLAFRTHDREAVETAGASIGLAETRLVVDAQGGYRGEVTYHIHNTTEQFLQVKLPAGAALWTARVADEPVKPIQDPAVPDPRQVRIPLVKTAPGDLSYAVVLKYGGQLAAPGSFRQMDFPLVLTVNIHVELSQARLFLPGTHRWFDFGGTMRPVADEASLAAGQVAYNSREAEHLRQTIRSGDDFAKLRAATNLKSIIATAPAGQPVRGPQTGNAELQERLEENRSLLEEARKDVDRLEARTANPQAASPSNPQVLNELYQRQQSARARNVLKDVGGNWSYQQPADAQGEERAGKDWGGKGGGKRGEVSKYQREAGWQSQPQTGPQLQQPASDGQSQQAATTPAEGVQQQEVQTLNRYKQQLSFQARQQRRASKSAAPMGGMGGAMGSGISGEANDRGEVQLGGIRRPYPPSAGSAYGSSSSPATRATAAPEFTVAKPVYESDAKRDERPAEQGDRVAMGRVSLDAAAATSPQTPPPASGLASLDVELPQYGRPFYFTTPRGEAEITAWSVSQELIQRLWDLGLILATLVVLLAGIALFRRPFWAALVGPSGSTHLIWIGLVMALLGIFPVVGLAAAIVGLGAKTVRGLGRGNTSRVGEGARA